MEVWSQYKGEKQGPMCQLELHYGQTLKNTFGHYLFPKPWRMFWILESTWTTRSDCLGWQLRSYLKSKSTFVFFTIFLDLIKSPSNNTNNHCTESESVHYKRRPHCNASTGIQHPSSSKKEHWIILSLFPHFHSILNSKRIQPQYIHSLIINMFH